MSKVRQALFHTIRFYTSPRNLARLEAISDSCAAYVKRAIFLDPMFPIEQKSREEFEYELDHGLPLSSRSVPGWDSEDQTENCVNSPEDAGSPCFSDDVREKGFAKLCELISEQSVLIESRHYVERWGRILNRLQSLEEIVARQWDDTRTMTEGKHIVQALRGRDLCFHAHGEDMKKVYMTDLQALHPEVVLLRDVDRDEQEKRVIALCLRADVRRFVFKSEAAEVFNYISWHLSRQRFSMDEHRWMEFSRLLQCYNSGLRWGCKQSDRSVKPNAEIGQPGHARHRCYRSSCCCDRRPPHPELERTGI